MASPLPFQDDLDLAKKRRLSLLSLGANSSTLPEGHVQSCEVRPCRERSARSHRYGRPRACRLLYP